MPNSSRNSEAKASYSLTSTRSFLRDLRKLDQVAIWRILRTIELLKEAPRSGKKLRGQLEGFWSLRAVSVPRMSESIRMLDRSDGASFIGP